MPPAPSPAELLADGALTVRRAMEFSGLSRNRLWELMDDGTLPWRVWGKARVVPRKALADYLAALWAASPEDPPRRAVPNAKG